MWRRLLLLWTASRVVTLGLGVLLTATLGWRRELGPRQAQPGLAPPPLGGRRGLEPGQPQRWLALGGGATEYSVRLSPSWYPPGLDVAFSPLYPALIEGARAVPRLDDAVVSLVVANAATLIGL